MCGRILITAAQQQRGPGCLLLVKIMNCSSMNLIWKMEDVMEPFCIAILRRCCKSLLKIKISVSIYRWSFSVFKFVTLLCNFVYFREGSHIPKIVGDLLCPVLATWVLEHLKRSWYELRCPISIKYMPDFEDLVLKSKISPLIGFCINYMLK